MDTDRSSLPSSTIGLSGTIIDPSTGGLTVAPQSHTREPDFLRITAAALDTSWLCQGCRQTDQPGPGPTGSLCSASGSKSLYCPDACRCSKSHAQSVLPYRKQVHLTFQDQPLAQASSNRSRRHMTPGSTLIPSQPGPDRRSTPLVKAFPIDQDGQVSDHQLVIQGINKTDR